VRTTAGRAITVGTILRKVLSARRHVAGAVDSE
jgi:hypothetical protein